MLKDDSIYSGFYSIYSRLISYIQTSFKYSMFILHIQTFIPHIQYAFQIFRHSFHIFKVLQNQHQIYIIYIFHVDMSVWLDLPSNPVIKFVAPSCGQMQLQRQKRIFRTLILLVFRKEKGLENEAEDD